MEFKQFGKLDMRYSDDSTDGAWTVAEAKAQLSEILRLSETQGPQRIGIRRRFVVVPEGSWAELQPSRRMPLGKWLVENWPRGANLAPPDRRSRRAVPFDDCEEPSAT